MNEKSKMDNERELTENEVNSLIDEILKKQTNKKEKLKSLSNEMQMLVHKAANSKDEEHVKLGRLLAYEAVERYYSKVASSYSEDYRTEIGDLKSELYILISENLKDYNGTNSLFTFFDPLVKRSYAKAKEKGRGLNSTRYFRDLGPFITSAIDEIKKMGVENPSSMDIKDYLIVMKNKDISETTIELWINSHKIGKSLDEFDKVIKDEDENKQPDLFLIKKEEDIGFYKELKKLNPKSQRVILIEIEYINKRKLIPTTKDIFPELVAEFPKLKPQEAEIMVFNAHNELKLIMSKKSKKRVILPLNKAKVIKDRSDFYKREDEDILEALKNNNFLDENE